MKNSFCPLYVTNFFGTLNDNFLKTLASFTVIGWINDERVKSIAMGVTAGACFGCNYKSGQTGRVMWYNKTLEYIDERVAQKATILIAPEKPLEISRVCHNPEVMQRVYDLGRRAAERMPEQT